VIVSALWDALHLVVIVSALWDALHLVVIVSALWNALHLVVIVSALAATPSCFTYRNSLTLLPCDSIPDVSEREEGREELEGSDQG